MNLVHALLGEHGTLKHQIEALRLAAPGYTPEQLRAAALALGDAIESHAEIEDELLLDPMAGDESVPRGPVEAMRAEHERIAELLDRVVLPEGAPGSGDPRRALDQLAETVIHHFAHEENVLFPIAAQRLGEAALAALGARWAERRHVALRLTAPNARG